MADAAPAWLLEMRAITGLSEKPGEADEPKIMAMADFIGSTFPDMSSYCNGYKHDSVPWCGLAEAYCMAKAGIRPPFGGTDTDRFWARAWADDPNFPKLSKPKLGCVVVITRDGGGTSRLTKSDAGSSIKCRGGNSTPSMSNHPKSSVIAYVRPSEGGIPPEPEEPTSDELPMLRRGDTGPGVAYMQSLIPTGSTVTLGYHRGAAREFQRAKGLIDGACGDDTWWRWGRPRNAAGQTAVEAG
jgi:hypothetical protein